MADREFSKGALTRLSWGALIVGILVVLLAILAYPLEIAPKPLRVRLAADSGGHPRPHQPWLRRPVEAQSERGSPVTYRGWNASPAKLAALISRPAIVPGLRVGPVTPPGRSRLSCGDRLRPCTPLRF